MSEGWNITLDHKVPKRERWDMKKCPDCRKHRRLCSVCAGVI